MENQDKTLAQPTESKNIAVIAFFHLPCFAPRATWWLGIIRGDN